MLASTTAPKTPMATAVPVVMPPATTTPLPAAEVPLDTTVPVSLLAISALDCADSANVFDEAKTLATANATAARKEILFKTTTLASDVA